jgi:hypothetical protein
MPCPSLPSHVHGPDLPPSPYRTLIDATERDVRLVLVGGDPLVGDRDIMNKLKPGQAEAIATTCAGYQKAVVATKAGVPKGDETFAVVEKLLNDGLVALGGDNPPPGGGLAQLSNTYSYLRNHFTLLFPMTNAQFMQLVLIPTVGTVGGMLNLEDQHDFCRCRVRYFLQQLKDEKRRACAPLLVIVGRLLGLIHRRLLVL